VTHSLHRCGSIENLSGDYVVIIMAAKGVNEENSRNALRRFVRLAIKRQAVTIGDMRQGCSSSQPIKDLIDGLSSTSIVHALFADRDKLKLFLKDLARANLGLSVTVSGLLEPLEQLTNELKLADSPHTVSYSLGVRGRIDLLPDQRVREITSMCGHALVSAALVEQAVDELAIGALTGDQCAQKLAAPCLCGIFNPCRAARLLTEMVAERSRQAQAPCAEPDANPTGQSEAPQA